MAYLTYNPKDVYILRRNADSSSFEELVLTASADRFVYFDSGSNLSSISTSSFASSVSSSYAETSSVTFAAASNATEPTAVNGGLYFNTNTLRLMGCIDDSLIIS